MKLSEAILEGCKVTKQWRGAYFSDDGACACALGAAAIGYCGNDINLAKEKIDMNIYDSLKWIQAQIPLDEIASHSLLNDIVGWNDVNEYSREEIAKMLADRGF